MGNKRNAYIARDIVIFEGSCGVTGIGGKIRLRRMVSDKYEISNDANSRRSEEHDIHRSGVAKGDIEQIDTAVVDQIHSLSSTNRNSVVARAPKYH